LIKCLSGVEELPVLPLRCYSERSFTGIACMIAVPENNNGIQVDAVVVSINSA